MSGPATGTPALHREALADAVTLMLRMVDIPPAKASATLAPVIRCYLMRARSRRSWKSAQVVCETHALAGMAVGDVRTFPDIAQRKVWRSRMKTARRIMGTPDASWQIDQRNAVVTIARLPDGVAPRKWKTPHPHAVTISRIPLHGYTMIADVARPMESGWAQSARRILNEPEARWISRTTTRGLKVTRVA